MPLFAYRCRSCGEVFQTLVMSGETPVCKTCESADLEQQLSLIAAPARGGDKAPMTGRCEAAEAGMCCGGACGMAA